MAVTSEGFRIFNADPLRQNKTECKSFMVLAESVKNDGENTNVYLGPAINDVVAGKSRVVKVCKSIRVGLSSTFKFYICTACLFSKTRKTLLKTESVKRKLIQNMYSIM